MVIWAEARVPVACVATWRCSGYSRSKGCSWKVSEWMFVRLELRNHTGSKWVALEYPTSNECIHRLRFLLTPMFGARGDNPAAM